MYIDSFCAFCDGYEELESENEEYLFVRSNYPEILFMKHVLFPKQEYKI